MFGKFKKPSVQVCQSVDTAPYFWCNEAVLIEVKNGRSALRWVRQKDYDNDYMYLSALMLKDRPILQATLPECPTCEGLLATGYGIEKIDCSELKEIADKINMPYEGINQAVSNISAILGLLQDGTYVIADCNVFPTDGNGNFFWDVPSELTSAPITAGCLTYIDDECNYTGGVPAFLYPSQSTDKFDSNCIEHYQRLLSDRQHFPRGIAYYCKEFGSILLDGHHKASACALSGETVPTLVIMPCTGVEYRVVWGKTIDNSVHFGEIKIPVSFFGAKQMRVAREQMKPWEKIENMRFNEYTLTSKN